MGDAARRRARGLERRPQHGVLTAGRAGERDRGGLFRGERRLATDQAFEQCKFDI